MSTNTDEDFKRLLDGVSDAPRSTTKVPASFEEDLVTILKDLIDASKAPEGIAKLAEIQAKHPGAFWTLIMSRRTFAGYQFAVAEGALLEKSDKAMFHVRLALLALRGENVDGTVSHAGIMVVVDDRVGDAVTLGISVPNKGPVLTPGAGAAQA